MKKGVFGLFRILFRKRRAWDSNPQLLSEHHISSVAASHSHTLRKRLAYSSLRYTPMGVKGFSSGARKMRAKMGALGLSAVPDLLAAKRL